MAYCYDEETLTSEEVNEVKSYFDKHPRHGLEKEYFWDGTHTCKIVDYYEGKRVIATGTDVLETVRKAKSMPVTVWTTTPPRFGEGVRVQDAITGLCGVIDSVGQDSMWVRWESEGHVSYSCISKGYPLRIIVPLDFKR